MKYIYSGLYENTNSTSTNMLLSREIHLTKALGQHCMAEVGTRSLAILPQRESHAHHIFHHHDYKQQSPCLLLTHKLRYTTMHSN